MQGVAEADNTCCALGGPAGRNSTVWLMNASCEALKIQGRGRLRLRGLGRH